MKDRLREIVEKSSSKDGLSKSDFIKLCKESQLIIFDNEYDLAVEYFKHCGINLIEKEAKVYSDTVFKEYKDATFCIVDIETNGNSVDNAQIIEIGAIKYKNSKVLDRFESFIRCDFVPEYIQRITNISQKDLVDAPKLKNVLNDFKLFLSDSVFVAHNVRFDYNFIADSFRKVGLPELLNRRLCTIDLAKKTIESEKYGLVFLKDKLNIDIENHHRAYADALSALEVLKISLKSIPDEVRSVEDLIAFSNPSKKKKKRRKPR